MEKNKQKPINTFIENLLSGDQPQNLSAKPVTEQKYNSKEQDISQVRPWVRYWARFFDLILFSFVVSFALVIIAPTILETSGIFLIFLIMQCWFFQESILLSTWGTTPGKWLLRIKVRDSNGKKLNILSALGRSFSVWLKGCGLGIPIVSLFTLLIARSRLKRMGVTIWDEQGGFVVRHYEIGAIRTTVAILFFIGIFLLLELSDTIEKPSTPYELLDQEVETSILPTYEDNYDTLAPMTIEQKLQTRIFLELRNAPIEDGLTLLANQADIEIVKSSEVTGFVTAKFTDVPVRDVLNNILVAHGYRYDVVYDTIRVAQAPGMVTAILYSEDNPSAAIDGLMVHIGDTIRGVKVVQIYQQKWIDVEGKDDSKLLEPAKVEFEKNGMRWTQGVQEPPAPLWE